MKSYFRDYAKEEELSNQVAQRFAKESTMAELTLSLNQIILLTLFCVKLKGFISPGFNAGKDMNVPIKWHKVREFTQEEAKDEIELLKTIIKFLQNRGFAWDMFLRPFRLMFYKHQLKKLKLIAGEEI